ncbi:ABC transporter ATP-binding protein [Rhodopila sp.]|uniref:ABC transporter ATP-binding protein n=1 Tax=Rhodopila sp. TaxID=2480087 RepID=UPI003D0D34E9
MPPEPIVPEPVVEVTDLSVRFVRRDLDVRVVDGVSFSLRAGEVLCLLGESGSGKTVTLRALLRLLPPYARIAGGIRLAGRDVTSMSERQLEAIRGPVAAMVFQEPMTALDPVFTIGTQIAETVVSHEGVSFRDGRRRALELLELVQVPSAAARLDAYPHELSGGLRQRAMIALALCCRPALLLADEPTTALDATVQIQILLLLRQLQKELGMATLFVTHDIGVACEVADRVAVMYAGRFIETGPIETIIGRPAHPFTAGLLRSTVHETSRGAPLVPIPGGPPDLGNLPAGCSFRPRCARQIGPCGAERPALRPSSDGGGVRCFNPLPASEGVRVGREQATRRTQLPIR